jgi:hypothetical protein
MLEKMVAAYFKVFTWRIEENYKISQSEQLMPA